jgi:tetratricopeptide (TPR) repeat protein
MTSSQRAAPAFVLGLVLISVAGPILAEHHENWIEIQAPHFTVLCNGSEYEGRKAAWEFEEIRALFEHLYPKLHVDSGKPTIVFALKNEDSLKLLLPSYGQNSKANHIGGFYHPSDDKNFAVVRTDVRGTGPLGNHALFHEYTHAFFRYNFRGLPVWLDEGLAEYYGNTSVENGEARVGMANEAQLKTLKESALLPIDQLVAIDRSSPLYNARQHSGIFYAESWALVHYLMISPDTRDQHLITKYLQLLHETDDPIEAAKQSFGDLNGFSDKLNDYVHRFLFQYQRLQLQSKLSDKDFPARKLSEADGTLRIADFLLRASHLPEGLERLHEVEKIDPATAGYHSEIGHYHLLNADYTNAEKELQAAIAADPKDVSAHIDMARVYLLRDNYTRESTPKIRAELEKVLRLSPNFAPSLAFLSIVYAREPDKNTDMALNAARRASQLEPGNIAYFIDIGKALLAAGGIPEARKIAETAQKVATTSAERNQATSFTKQIDNKVRHPQESAGIRVTEDDPASRDFASAESTEDTLHAEGQIAELICGHPPEVILTLTTDKNSLLLHVSNIAKIAIQDGGKASDATQSPCAKWKDKHAKIGYRAAASAMAKGEVESISLE